MAEKKDCGGCSDYDYMRAHCRQGFPEELKAALEREKVLMELVDIAPSLIEDVINEAEERYPLESRKKYPSYNTKYANAIQDAIRTRLIISRVKAMREGNTPDQVKE